MYPIFDGLRKSYLIQQNRIQLAQLDNEMRYLKYSIDLEQEQAKRDFANSLENLRAQEENMELALEVFQTTNIKYQEGIGSNLEVVDAETSYKNAPKQLLQCIVRCTDSQGRHGKGLGITL